MHQIAASSLFEQGGLSRTLKGYTAAGRIPTDRRKKTGAFRPITAAQLTCWETRRRLGVFWGVCRYDDVSRLSRSETCCPVLKVSQRQEMILKTAGAQKGFCQFHSFVFKDSFEP